VLIALGVAAGVLVQRSRPDERVVLTSSSTVIYETVTRVVPRTSVEPKLQKVVYVSGSGIPIGDLAPTESSTHAWWLPAQRGGPFLLVAWHRSDEEKERQELNSRTRGVILWHRRHKTWRMVYARRHPWWIHLWLDRGDVTGDGRTDVLLSEENGGSGGCGVRRVLAPLPGRAREIFRRHLCEAQVALEDGAVIVNEAIGPCPYPEGSAHCFGGRKTSELRWNGAKLRPVRVTIECAFPRLDPSRSCEPRAGR
jgi:hypothetical protein